MRFAQEMCRELFPGAEIRVTPEPSLTIAKGLALVGRTVLKVQAFREEVDKVLDSTTTLSKIVDRSLPDLHQRLSNAFVEFAEFTAASLRRWEAGQIHTTAELQEDLRRIEAEKLWPLLEIAAANWLEDLCRKIDDITAGICDLYGITPLSLKIPLGEVSHDILNTNMIAARAIVSAAAGLVKGVLPAVAANSFAVGAGISVAGVCVFPPVGGFIAALVSRIVIVSVFDKIVRPIIFATTSTLQMRAQLKLYSFKLKKRVQARFKQIFEPQILLAQIRKQLNKSADDASVLIR